MLKLLIRALYCEMLGYNSDFAHLPCITLCQNPTNLLEKRLAYTIISVFLHPEHEMLLLLVNTLQRDLQSGNAFDICMALDVMAEIMNFDVMNSLIDCVEAHLNHTAGMVRRKAFTVYKHMFKISPEKMAPYIRLLKHSLADSDLLAMQSAVFMFSSIIEIFPKKCVSLIPALIHIIDQILEGKLGEEFNYNSVPAPWTLTECIRTLGMFHELKKETSKLITDAALRVLAKINRTDEESATFSIIYEAIKTISKLDHSIDVSSYISPFVFSKSSKSLSFGLSCLNLCLVNSVKEDLLIKGDSIPEIKPFNTDLLNMITKIFPSTEDCIKYQVKFNSY